MDELLLVHDGRVETYADDLEGYERWILSELPDRSSALMSPRGQLLQGKNERSGKAKSPPAAENHCETEAEMNAVEIEQAAVQTRLSDTDLYSGGRKQDLAALLKREGELKPGQLNWKKPGWSNRRPWSNSRATQASRTCKASGPVLGVALASGPAHQAQLGRPPQFLDGGLTLLGAAAVGRVADHSIQPAPAAGIPGPPARWPLCCDSRLSRSWATPVYRLPSAQRRI